MMFGITTKRKGYGTDWYWRGRYRGTFGHSPVPYVIVKFRGYGHILSWRGGRIRYIRGFRHEDKHATP